MMAAVPRAAEASAMASPSRACPICGTRSARPLHHQRYATFDDSALPDDTRIVACDDCGVVYAASTATADDYRRHYALHSKYDTAAKASGSGETVADAARLDDLVRFVAPSLRPSSSIADVGAGRGGLLDAFRRHGFEDLAGIDPSAGCVATMRSRGFAAGVGTLEDDAWPTDPRRFDLIVLSHVVEHVFDVSGAFARVVRRVRDDGLIYVEVPDASRYTTDGYPPFYFFDAEHINHFDAATLARCAARHGWSVASAWPRLLELDGGARYPAVGVLLRRGGAGSIDGAGPAEAVASYVGRSHAAVASDPRTRIVDELAASRTPVVVWGAGSHAQRLLAQTALARCAIDCVIDGDPGKQGRRLAGHLVVSPDEGLARCDRLDGAVVVIAIAVGGEAVQDRLRRTRPALRVVRL